MNYPSKKRQFSGLLAGSQVLGVGLWLGLSQLALADEPIAITDTRECREITADAERLLCYDTVVDGDEFSQKQLTQVQKENFGIKKTSADISVDQLLVTIVEIQKATSGVYYFHTDDGSVWKQKTRGSWNLPVPFKAEIKSGVLGSYFLVAEGGKSTRVKRVR